MQAITLPEAAQQLFLQPADVVGIQVVGEWHQQVPPQTR